MKINKQRLWNHLQELSNIGKAKDGSITRFPFTKEDGNARDLILSWMKEAGLQTRVDAAGNVIGVVEGREPSLKPVVCGSHFDTVTSGGAFDGTLGVLGGIEALASIKEAGILPRRSLMVIGFKDEEGNRFGYGMIGSKAICGVVEQSGLASRDSQGITLYEAMKEAGYDPDHLAQCNIIPYTFVELHIEQAKVLEEHHCSVGIVTGIAGLARYTLHIFGESAHAGATPMSQRCDPVVAAASWITSITELAKQHAGCVATIGQIQTLPGACNIICEEVVISLDIRCLHMQVVQEIMETMQQVQCELMKQHGVHFVLHKEQEIASAYCDKQLQEQLQRCCEQRALRYQYLVSGAGHDCMNFKDVCPIAMIFVRSKKGYSHRKEEYSSMEDCKDGTLLLADMLFQLAT